MYQRWGVRQVYKTYALAILAGERDINNLKGAMRDRVQAELDKLHANELK